MVVEGYDSVGKFSRNAAMRRAQTLSMDSSDKYVFRYILLVSRLFYSLYFLPRMVAYRLLQANPCTRKAAHHTRTHTHTKTMFWRLIPSSPLLYCCQDVYLDYTHPPLYTFLFHFIFLFFVGCVSRYLFQLSKWPFYAGKLKLEREACSQAE